MNLIFRSLVSDRIIYMPFDQTDNRSRYDYGNIVFALVSLRSDILPKTDDLGLPTPLSRTMTFEVWNYLWDANLSKLTNSGLVATPAC